MSDDHDDPLGTGLSSIVRMSGVNVPARARFVGEAIVSATLSSVTLGFCSGALGAVLGPATLGPLVPYMMGSAVGYTFGLWQNWWSAKRRTLWYATQYPTLLAHALRTEHQIIVPSAVVKASQEKSRAQQDDDEEDFYKAGGYTSHVVSNEGPTTMDQWILRGGLGRITWSILAAQHCRSDAEGIQRQQRQKIVDNFDSAGGEDDE